MIATLLPPGSWSRLDRYGVTPMLSRPDRGAPRDPLRALSATQRSRRLLDAVYGEPRVQAAPAPCSPAPRICITSIPPGAAFSMAPPASGAATPAIAREPIVAAIQEQAASLDFCAPFQFSHPKAFQLASRIAALAPGDLDHVFFTNSGSEAVDTALKIALAFHNVSGQSSRQRADRARSAAITASGFGGTAVGGIGANRKVFGPLFGPASTTCLRPTAASTRPSASASRIGAPTSPTTSTGWPPCTIPRRSRR